MSTTSSFAAPVASCWCCFLPDLKLKDFVLKLISLLNINFLIFCLARINELLLISVDGFMIFFFMTILQLANTPAVRTVLGAFMLFHWTLARLFMLVLANWNNLWTLFFDLNLRNVCIRHFSTIICLPNFLDILIFIRAYSFMIARVWARVNILAKMQSFLHLLFCRWTNELNERSIFSMCMIVIWALIITQDACSSAFFNFTSMLAVIL